MNIAQLLFALTTSTIILWAIIGLIALAITMANKSNEKTPSNTMIGMVKGMLAATSVLSFFTTLATIFAFVYYKPFMWYNLSKQRKENIMFYEEEYYNPYDDPQAPESPLYENDLNGNGIDDDCEDPYDMDDDGYNDYDEYY